MLREVIENPIQMDGSGYIAVPEGAGLGITVNEKAVKKFCVNL
jgi:L-alanine-DL-glutamate epimerase-like enolase superfamily enzyme